jgi:hypothetical protein
VEKNKLPLSYSREEQELSCARPRIRQEVRHDDRRGGDRSYGRPRGPDRYDAAEVDRWGGSERDDGVVLESDVVPDRRCA